MSFDVKKSIEKLTSGDPWSMGTEGRKVPLKFYSVFADF
jgi:hypothetical protein